MKTGFQGKLSATEIGECEGRSVWKLDKPLTWVLNQCVSIEVPEGFQSDLASVPRLPIIYALWGDRAHREAVIHDFMYRSDARTVQGKSISKENADWYFHQAMLINCQPYWIYQPMWWAVATCGASSFHRMKINDSFPLDRKE